jgi:hypothetical protein
VKGQTVTTIRLSGSVYVRPADGAPVLAVRLECAAGHLSRSERLQGGDGIPMAARIARTAAAMMAEEHVRERIAEWTAGWTPSAQPEPAPDMR